jgi:uncharacterized protein YcbK (DUF882 family)
MINWDDMKSQLTPNFTVGEALYLPSYKVYHKPTDEEKANIVKHAASMELVREYLGTNPINITCWIRPLAINCDNPMFNGRNYNRLVGGAENSAHIQGLACDFTVSRITCDDVRHLLEDQLERLQLRMEKKPNANWVHLDSRQPVPGKSRYFIP